MATLSNGGDDRGTPLKSQEVSDFYGDIFKRNWSQSL